MTFQKNSKEFSESLYFGYQNTWILLFNFQWAVLFAALPCGSQLIYYTTLSFVCQEVFQTFFKFFSSSRLSPTLRCRSLAAPIVYHILPRLSTPFCKFFRDISIFPASKVTALGLWVLYWLHQCGIPHRMCRFYWLLAGADKETAFCLGCLYCFLQYRIPHRICRFYLLLAEAYKEAAFGFGTFFLASPMGNTVSLL